MRQWGPMGKTGIQSKTFDLSRSGERIMNMQEATISIHVGTRFSEAHNKRLVKGLDHIEYSPTEAGRGFFVLEEHDKNQLYVELFADALEEFNERQKRNDRKIDYLTNGQPDGEKILKYMRSLKGREREVIIQVGNMRDTIDKNIKVELLKEMYEQFKADNPNLKIIASYLHNDEADPHLHVDFIPVFTNTGKGVGKMVGFDKALCEQMGIQYERSAKGKNAKGEEINLNRRYHAPWFEQWRLMNHTHFSRLLLNREIIPIKGEISYRRHKNTVAYQKMQDSIKTLQNDLNEATQEKNHLSQQLNRVISQNETFKERLNAFKWANTDVVVTDLVQALGDIAKSSPPPVFVLANEIAKVYNQLRANGHEVFEGLIETYNVLTGDGRFMRFLDKIKESVREWFNEGFDDSRGRGR